MYISIVLNVILVIMCIYYYRQSCIDSYTKLLNKAQFHQDIQQMKRANDTVVLIDIDQFKHINDTRGHAYGDEVIGMVSKTIKDNIRSSDRAYRIGGDEFAIITCSDAVGFRIQSVLKDHDDIDISIGTGNTYEKADIAMYINKHIRKHV